MWFNGGVEVAQETLAKSRADLCGWQEPGHRAPWWQVFGGCWSRGAPCRAWGRQIWFQSCPSLLSIESLSRKVGLLGFPSLVPTLLELG